MHETERKVAAQVLRAMGHPIRLGVLELLAEGEKNVTELFEQLNCSQSMMSQQLRTLEQQGLIRTRKEGTMKFCSLQNRELLKLFDCLQHHLQTYLQPGRGTP